MQGQSSDRSGIGNTIARSVKDANENAASSSQAWHQNENTRSSIGKPIAKSDQHSGIGKPIAQIQNRLTETRMTHHNFEIFNVHTSRKSSRMYDKN